MIRSVILSQFDVVEGPKIMHAVPNITPGDIRYFEFVPRLLDIMDKQDRCFMNSNGDIFSLNYYFEMKCSGVRGNKILAMISVVIQAITPKEKEKISSFLSTQEPNLESIVTSIKEDPQYHEECLFHPSNEVKLVKQLHGVHRQFFVESNFMKQLDHEHGMICVMGPKLFNPREEIERYQAMLMNDGRSLKSKLVLKAISEFEYIHFYCLDRDNQLETCEREDCPVCRTFALESDATIYAFNNTRFDFNTDIDDFMDFIRNIGSVSALPILVLEIQEHHVDSSQSSSIKEGEMKFREAFESIQAELENHPMHFVQTDFSDESGFVEGISWLLKQLI